MKVRSGLNDQGGYQGNERVASCRDLSKASRWLSRLGTEQVRRELFQFLGKEGEERGEGGLPPLYGLSDLFLVW